MESPSLAIIKLGEPGYAFDGPCTARKAACGCARAFHTNQVYHLQKPDYSHDVTEASQKSFVLVHLTSSLGTNVESRLMTELWRDLARRYGEVKFCEIRADMCIEGYPERNTPTILIYKDGDIKKQIVTLKELRGQGTTAEGVCSLVVDKLSRNSINSILQISKRSW